jgi:hypothetical protein
VPVEFTWRGSSTHADCIVEGSGELGLYEYCPGLGGDEERGRRRLRAGRSRTARLAADDPVPYRMCPLMRSVDKQAALAELGASRVSSVAARAGYVADLRSHGM